MAIGGPLGGGGGSKPADFKPADLIGKDKEKTDSKDKDKGIKVEEPVKEIVKDTGKAKDEGKEIGKVGNNFGTETAKVALDKIESKKDPNQEAGKPIASQTFGALEKGFTDVAKAFTSLLGFGEGKKQAESKPSELGKAESGGATKIKAPEIVAKDPVKAESESFKPVVKASGGIEKQAEELQKAKTPLAGDTKSTAIDLQQQQTTSKPEIK